MAYTHGIIAHDAESTPLVNQAINKLIFQNAAFFESHGVKIYLGDEKTQSITKLLKTGDDVGIGELLPGTFHYSCVDLRVNVNEVQNKKQYLVGFLVNMELLGNLLQNVALGQPLTLFIRTSNDLQKLVAGANDYYMAGLNYLIIPITYSGGVTVPKFSLPIWFEDPIDLATDTNRIYTWIRSAILGLTPPLVDVNGSISFKFRPMIVVDDQVSKVDDLLLKLSNR